MRFFYIFILLFSASLFAGGKLQNADFKTEAELVTAGADKSYLLNDDKIYVLAFDKTLDDAIADGDIGGQLTAKGNLFGFGTATQECILDKTDGKLLTVDSTATCGFDFKDAPVSTTLSVAGQIQGFSTTNEAIGPCDNDGEYLVRDNLEPTKWKCSSFLTGTLNPVTNWTEYTLEITSTGTSPTKDLTPITDFARYRIVGDTMEITYSYVADSAGTAGTGTYLFNLPSGFTIDTSKIYESATGVGLVGQATSFNGSSIYSGHMRTTGSSASALIMYLGKDDTALSSVSGTNLALDNANRQYSFRVSVPIVGYSSGVGAIAQNKKMGAAVLSGAGVQSVSNGTAEKVQIGTLEINKGNFTTSSNSIVVPSGADGLYLVSGSIGFNSAASGGRAICTIKVNGTAVTTSRNLPNNQGLGSTSCPPKAIELVENDVVSMDFTNNTGAAQTIDTSIQATFLNITQQPENFVIAATIPSATTLNTKGQIQGYSTENANIQCNNNGEYLIKDDTQPTGWRCSGNITGKLSEANFVGSATIPRSPTSDADCDLVPTTTNITTGEVGTTGACDTTGILEGNIEFAVDSDTTAYNINVVAGRRYRINVHDFIYNLASSVGRTCTSYISLNGGSTNNVLRSSFIDTANAGLENSQMGSFFEFTATTTGIQEILYRVQSSPASNCEFLNRLGFFNLTIYEFPAAKTVAVSENELDEFTSNELSAIISAPSTIVSENHDWLTSCSQNGAGTGHVDCLVKADVFSVAPSCSCTANNGNTTQSSTCKIRSTSTSAVTFSISNGNTLPSFGNLPFHIQCSKQGVDVNKTQVVKGTFGDCQTKYLSADVTTNTTGISDLGFSGLGIGQKYKICLSPYFGVANPDNQIALLSIHDGSTVAAARVGNGGSSVTLHQFTTCSASFTATATTITHNSFSVALGSDIRGNGTSAETYVTLCEDKTGENTTW